MYSAMGAVAESVKVTDAIHLGRTLVAFFCRSPQHIHLFLEALKNVGYRCKAERHKLGTSGAAKTLNQKARTGVQTGDFKYLIGS
jgi:hypothetical protein